MRALVDLTSGEVLETFVPPAGELVRVADADGSGFTWRDQEWSDGKRALLPVLLAELPEGHQWAGAPSYALGDGKVIETRASEPIPVMVPVSISPLQARKALRAAGLKAAVDAFVATLPDAQQEEWEFCSEVRRDNPIIAAGAVELGLTGQQIDDLFILGATL